MKYKLYAEISKIELIGVFNIEELNIAVSEIKDNINIIIIEHDIEQDIDFPYFVGKAEKYKLKEKEKIYEKIQHFT